MTANEANDPGDLLVEGTSDPDAQATITDFIDYTEYLPSDLIRSLTLIRGLDESYLKATESVHELTKTYGQLPDLPPDSQPEPQVLRKQISQQLDRAINARESSYAEACRLYDVVDRHFDRLGSIKGKLNALPKPPSAPSRAPSVPANPPATENKRAINQRKQEDTAPTTRITLRVDGSRAGGANAARQKDSTSRAGSRTQQSATADGHLTPFKPDSPIASTEQSGLETENAAARQLEASADTEKIPDEKDDKSSKGKKQKQRKASRTPRPPGMGTNVHSSVAGISTSNALAMLKPPPENAKMGSEDLPWLRLTEWEMTKLRKKMKKNAVWQPSEIMIHRELAVRGRGWEGYRKAKANAEKTGEELVDCDDIMTNYVPGKLVRKGEEGADVEGVEETKLSNRGMKLNEAKKLKRENLAREQAALAATEAELAAKRLSDIGSTFKTLFTSPTKQSHSVPELSENSSKANDNAVKDREKPKTPKKRKFEETALPENPASSQDADASAAVSSSISKPPNGKKRKPNKPATVVTNLDTAAAQIAVPPKTAAGMTDASKKSSPLSSPAGSKRSAAVAPKAVPTPTPPTTRPPSRRRSGVTGSVEPTISTAARDRPRRKSMTPAANKTPAPDPTRQPAATAAARRSKRPAPGPVTSGQDGGAAVSVGRRKAKPAVRKKALPKDPNAQKESPMTSKQEEVRIDEDGVLEEIDPNEPRYCLCGDVSFGTMICCENNDVRIPNFLYIIFHIFGMSILNSFRMTFVLFMLLTLCPQCDKEWFHLDCVGLTDVPSRTAKWYCPDCRQKLGKGITDGIVKVGGRR